MNKNQVLFKLQERFKENQLDESVFDFDSEYDNNLSPSENYTILKEKVDDLIGKEINEIVSDLKSGKYELMQREAFDQWMDNNPQEIERLINIFDKPKIISLIGDVNTGKTNALYYFIEILKKEYDFNLFSYGLKCDLGERKIYSIEELERIRDSVIIIDEFFSLFDLEDRKKRKLIEKTLRLIAHNNNVLVLAGVPDNFKKFIAGKTNMFIFGRCSISDFINGSKCKEICLSYMGSELGSTVLDVSKEYMLIYDGKHYSRLNVPYLPRYDSKKRLSPILRKRA